MSSLTAPEETGSHVFQFTRFASSEAFHNVHRCCESFQLVLYGIAVESETYFSHSFEYTSSVSYDRVERLFDHD